MDSEYEKILLNKITHSVRASQAVLQYGVGAMVDFPEQTLMTAAPETWEGSVVEIMTNGWKKCFMLISLGCRGVKTMKDIRVVLHIQDFRSGTFARTVDHLNP